jgi:hypothetical protein
MTALVLALALASAAAPDGADVVEPARFHGMVDRMMTDPEYRHLLRFREAQAPMEEPPPSSPRAARPSQPASRPGPQGGGGAAPSLSLPTFGGFAEGLRILVYVALAVVLGWIVFLTARLLGSRSGEKEALGGDGSLDAAGPAAGEQAPDEYLRQASAHARAGRHGEAIRLLLLGALAALEKRGLIHQRRGLTNGDYLRAVAGEPSLRRSLEGIVRAFDEIHFGRRAATAERFEDCLRDYRAGFAWA